MSGQDYKLNRIFIIMSFKLIGRREVSPWLIRDLSVQIPKLKYRLPTGRERERGKNILKTKS